MKVKTRAPIIRALNYTPETVAEVKRIQTSEPITKKKEMIRSLLQGPMCAVCSQVPDFRVEYHMTDILKIECYCNACFTNVYQKTRDIDINQIAEAYNCTIVPPGVTGSSKSSQLDQCQR